MTDLLSETLVAARLGVSPRTLQRWRVLGDGPTYRKLGKRVLYAPIDVEAFVEAAKRHSTRDRGGEAA